MMRKISKKENLGITLIALVITIVALIILATVVINLSLGQNGLFNKAKYASQSYKNAQDYEEAEIAKATNEINSYAGSTRNGIPVTIDGEEHEIGTFFGQKLYQKGFIGKTPSTDASLLDIDGNVISLSNLKIDKCINIYGTVLSIGGYVPLGYSQSDYITAYYHTGNKDIQVRAGESYYRNVPCYIILEYTKVAE